MFEEELKFWSKDEIEYNVDRTMYGILLKERSLHPTHQLFLFLLLKRRVIFKCKLHELEDQWRDSLTTEQILTLRKIFEEYYVAQDKIKVE